MANGQDCKTCPMKKYPPSNCEYAFKVKYGASCRKKSVTNQ